jgi:hypothetical protein
MSSTTSRSRSVSQDIIVVLALLTPPAPGRDRLLKSREGKSGASAHKIVGCGNATQEFHLTAKRSHFYQ